MCLLLFGCTGFVGRELLPLLLQAGHQRPLLPSPGAGVRR